MTRKGLSLNLGVTAPEECSAIKVNDTSGGVSCTLHTCTFCGEEIVVTESGLVTIKNNTYHPTCVQCHLCKKQVDGSLLDSQGRMVCAQCLRKNSGSGDNCKVSLRHTESLSVTNRSEFAKEPPVSPAELSEFENTFLEFHNKFRARHKVQHLVWSDKLTAKARKWAIHLIAESKRNNSSKLLAGQTGSNRSGLGETCCTISALTKPTPSGMAERVCSQWYETGEHFAVGETAVNKRAASFTQMVWRETKRVGACLMWQGQVALIVSFYWPPGNVENEFSTNVTKVMRTPRPARKKVQVDSDSPLSSPAVNRVPPSFNTHN